MRSWVLALSLVAVVVAQGRFLAKPDPEKCAKRQIQWTHGGHGYLFSFDITDDPDFLENGEPKKFDWLAARNVCRERCMDAVGLESESENKMILKFIQDRNIKYIWTSGRLCDFTGCDEREDLKPLNVKGWFFSDTNTKMADTNNRPKGWGSQPWSQTGHTGVPQPDNAEFSINKTPESCMGVLNNIYKDGIVWHDIACYHKKPVVCEENKDLLGWASQQPGGENISPIGSRPNRPNQTTPPPSQRPIHFNNNNNGRPNNNNGRPNNNNGRPNNNNGRPHNNNGGFSNNNNGRPHNNNGGFSNNNGNRRPVPSHFSNRG